MMQRPGRDVSQGKSRLAWRIAAATALIVLSIVALLITSIIKIRRDFLAQAHLRASYLSAALAQDAEGALDTAAVASEFVRRRVEAEGDGAPLAELKQEIGRYLPHLINISVIGPEGRLRATAGDVASSAADFSRFEFFIANRDSTSSGFRVGKPVNGVIADRIVSPATQRLEKNDGAFAGVVLFSMDPAQGTLMYHRVDIGNTGSILVTGTDGTIYAGYTLPRGFDLSLIGTIAADPQTIDRFQEAPVGSYLATSAIDGIERIYSWRKLKDFPLIAFVGLGKAEALADANQQAILLSALGIFAVGLTARVDCHAGPGEFPPPQTGART
ncbi:MAG: hypothetical protein WBX25_27965 [Rhodomicrobium sp.]